MTVPDGFAGEVIEACGTCWGWWTQFPLFNRKSQAIAIHITKALKEEKTITAIILPPSPSFLILLTSTPKGLFVIPLLSWPGYGSSSIVEMLKGEGGEGGRPAGCMILRGKNWIKEYRAKRVQILFIRQNSEKEGKNNSTGSLDSKWLLEKYFKYKILKPIN